MIETDSSTQEIDAGGPQRPDNRAQYNTPELKYYGSLTELTRNNANDPPSGDIFGTGYTPTA
jgi:hypothetical protein